MKDPDLRRELKPVYEEFARDLDPFGLMLTQMTDYHEGPEDQDLTDYALAFPSQSRVIKSSHILGRVNSRARRPYVRELSNFEGGRVKRHLSLPACLETLRGYGERMIAADLPRETLAEYLSLIAGGRRQGNPERALDVLRLPLDSFDRRQVLLFAPEMIAEMRTYAGVNGSVLYELFNLEAVREQDIAYKSMKKRGLLGKAVGWNFTA